MWMARAISSLPVPLSPDQHGRAEGRHAVDLGQDFLHALAAAHDVVDLIIDLGHFLLKAELLPHHEAPLFRDGAVEPDGLADQVGHHGQQADVAVEVAGVTVVADAVDGQHADAFAGRLDRHADEADDHFGEIGPAAGAVEEQRLVRKVGDDGGHAGLDDAPDDPSPARYWPRSISSCDMPRPAISLSVLSSVSRQIRPRCIWRW